MAIKSTQAAFLTDFTFDICNATTTKFRIVTGTGNTTTAHVWFDEYGVVEHDIYTGGTKLLRDYAQRSNEYLEKKEISQRGWKSRYELRNG